MTDDIHEDMQRFADQHIAAINRVAELEEDKAALEDRVNTLGDRVNTLRNALAGVAKSAGVEIPAEIMGDEA